MITFVAAGTNLQSALDSAQAGDTLQLDSGAVFRGHFVLPSRDGSAPIVVQGKATLIGSAGGWPVLITAPGAHRWHLRDLTITSGMPSSSDLIRLGSPRQTAQEAPHGLVLEDLIIVGHPTSQKRGIALNSGATHIVGCQIRGIKLAGIETQAIAGWNGPGPYLIENNYLEAGSIGVLFGGSYDIETSLAGLVPSRITFRRNTVTRLPQLRWQGYAIKNLLELKNARDVIIEDNLFENNWLEGQAGFAIVLTPKPSGEAPWTVVEHVVFRGNRIRNSASGINISGSDTRWPSQQTNNIEIVNNVIELDREKWGGSGTFVQFVRATRNVDIHDNTVISPLGRSIMFGPGPPEAAEQHESLIYVQNVSYGHIKGDGTAVGTATLGVYAPDAMVRENIFVGENVQLYPPDNIALTAAELQTYWMSGEFGRYRWRPSADWPWIGASQL